MFRRLYKSYGAIRIFAYIALIFTVFSAVFSLMPVRGEAMIYEDVVRLHILANSDSVEDQRLKLAVRDEIIAYMKNELMHEIDCVDADEAYFEIEKRLGDIKKKAEEFLAQNSLDISVKVELSREEYPRREYGEIVLPSGIYNSLRVILGQGEGKNWWCVLYPPLCLKCAAGDDLSGDFIKAELENNGFEKDEGDFIIKNSNKKYKIRFRILEILSEIFSFEY